MRAPRTARSPISSSAPIRIKVAASGSCAIRRVEFDRPGQDPFHISLGVSAVHGSSSKQPEVATDRGDSGGLPGIGASSLESTPR